MATVVNELLEKCANFYKEEKYNEIIKLLSDDLLEEHKDVDLYGWVAAAYKKLSEKKKAIEYYTKAVKINDRYHIGFNNRAVIYHELGEKQKALDDYENTINISPTSSMAFHNRGLVYFEMEKYDFAIADFEKALSFDYDKFNSLEKNLEEAKESLLLQGLSKSKKEIKELKNKMENNVQAILKETKEDKVKYVAHYTKLGVVKSIVEKQIQFDKTENIVEKLEKKSEEIEERIEKINNGLWYFNVIYMNDPEEGEILFKHFLTEKSIKECFENGKRANETSVYLGCFLSADEDNSHEDDLVMWRTYGKDERKNEAAGCSMTISSDFFDKEEDNIKYRKMELSMATSTDKEAIEMKQPQALLKVIYLNKKNTKKSLPKNIAKELTDLKTNLNKLIELRDIKYRKEEEKKLIDRIVFEKLSKICYLFKSSDYEFENEIRVIEYVPLGSRKIKKLKLPPSDNVVTGDENPPARLYIESNKDILQYTDKIYLGAKVPNHNHWSTYLDYEIRQREKEREKRDGFESDEPKIKIEIIKSTCNFQ